MSTQNENLLVTLIKKSVGLPTESSDCCGSTSSASSDCCGAETSDASQSSGCGCGNGDCGGTEEKKESESSPAVGSSAI